MSIPKEPRQMMINMMYLVLTALLALNVSAEILNAFHVVNQGITNSNDAISKKNSNTMEVFKAQLDIQKDKAKPYFDKATEATQIVEAFVSKVQGYADLIVSGSGGWTDEKGGKHDKGFVPGNGNQLSSDANLEVSTRLMLDQGRAKELKALIEKTRNQLLDLVDPADKALFEKQLPIRIDPPMKNQEGELKDWEEANFHMVPTIAALTLLNKFANDAKTSEAQILEYLLGRINAKDFKVDRIVAKVIAPTSYVMQGQEYKSDIFVAAYSSAAKPKVLVGSLNDFAKKDSFGNYMETHDNPVNGGQEVKVEGGMGKYTTVGSGEGPVQYSGAVVITGPDGKDVYYPFQSEYQVAKGAVVISPEKMNVFYAGVENPVSISVPGFPADKVRATISAGGITGGNGKYTVTEQAGIPAGADVTVTVEMPDKSIKQMGTMHFRVKDIPTPNGRVGNLVPGTVTVGTFSIQQYLFADLGADFLFDIKFPVLSYDVSYVPNKKDLIGPKSFTGGSLAPISDLMHAARPKDLFYFENIKVRMPNGTIRSLPSVTYKLN